jgi:hypothetical protein
MMRYSLSRVNLFDVVEDVDDISDPPGCLLDFGRQAEATHGKMFHIVPYKRLGIVKALEKDLRCGHSDLKILQSLVI